MEQRENQRIMLSKRLIKESLIVQLGQESIHKISIRTLCAGAGINRSTFYKHYGSQYDVLAEIEEDLIRSIQATLSEGDMERMIAAICTYIEQNVAMIALLIGNNVDPEFPSRLFSLPQLKQMIVARLARHYDAATSEQIYAFLISGYYRLVEEWLRQEEREPLQELVRLMVLLSDRICTS